MVKIPVTHNCQWCGEPMMISAGGWKACADCDMVRPVIPDLPSPEPKRKTMKDYLKTAGIRAARTFVQAFLGVYVAGLIANATTTLSDFANVSLLDAATAAGLVAVLSLVQNLLEERTSVNYNRG